MDLAVVPAASAMAAMVLSRLEADGPQRSAASAMSITGFLSRESGNRNIALRCGAWKTNPGCGTGKTGLKGSTTAQLFSLERCLKRLDEANRCRIHWEKMMRHRRLG